MCALVILDRDPNLPDSNRMRDNLPYQVFVVL